MNKMIAVNTPVLGGGVLAVGMSATPFMATVAITALSVVAMGVNVWAMVADNKAHVSKHHEADMLSDTWACLNPSARIQRVEGVLALEDEFLWATTDAERYRIASEIDDLWYGAPRAGEWGYL